jgi:pyridoxamine 5'-phosphate oxidase
MDERFLRQLRETDADPDPIAQFRRWYAEAVAAQVPDVETMTLATATDCGVPSARMVLLRGFDERGFVFFTNLESRKAEELSANPRAALVFYWGPLYRQVRIEGRVEAVSDDEADVYFATRPRGSQLSAWASPQSRVVPDREFLVARVRQRTADFPHAVPRPPFWSGFRVIAAVIEFWQGGENRLHDRLQYRRAGNAWIRERLAP